MSRSSGVVRDLTLLIGVPFVLMVGLLVWWPSREGGRAPATGDLFASLTGRWSARTDSTACLAGQHTSAFDRARTRMSVTSTGGTRDEYLIQGHGPDRLITLLVGDSTRDDQGAQVVWLLITTSDTSYVWRRRDWITGHVSEPNVRCSVTSRTAAIIPR